MPRRARPSRPCATASIAPSSTSALLSAVFPGQETAPSEARRPEVRPKEDQNEGTGQMIVIGADTHKRTHTCGAVDAATGRLAGELTAVAREPGFRELLAWGRDLDEERVWAIEDCR